MRTEPPESLPSPSAAMPTATATPSPLLLAPGVYDRSQGLYVLPYNWLAGSEEITRSGMSVWPIGMAPAARSRRTGGESASAT
ncbi:hypothetical protein O1M07_41410 [Streptomyces albulus]|nr:hypothetical protein [Streptomyces noursei]MCZ1020486.1 hypothetical protein [Streptomyces noursei]